MRILYLSCHETLEYDEVSMFTDMGHYVFSPGAYVEPDNRGDGNLRPRIPGLVYDPDDVAAYHRLGGLCPGKDGKEHLAKEFVDRFDCVIVMHIPRWIMNNWEAMEHKRVVWRTIGQCLPHQELAMQPYRNAGLKIVRYSPREEVLEHYAGCDAMIRFAKDPDFYRGWTGERRVIVNFTQSMPKRGDACNYRLYQEVMSAFPPGVVELYGPENEAFYGNRGKVSHEQQLKVLQSSRVYFYAGTHPASYTLNFIEAWMTGIPVVAIGPHHGNAPFHRRPAPGESDEGCLYEVARMLVHGGGFASDDVGQLQRYIQMMLDDLDLANRVSRMGRQQAIEHFGRPTIMDRWRQFFETL